MKEKIIVFLLKTVARLPLALLYLLSDFAFFVIYYLVGYRRQLVTKNLTESFPEKNQKEIEQIGKKYYRFLADQIIETVKTFHISDKELSRRVKVLNYEGVNASLENGKNVVLLMSHYGNWEWVQEISRYFIPSAFMASLYQPLADPTWDNIYKKLRSRWGAHIISSHFAPRVLLNKDNMPWVCGFIADQRPGPKSEKNIMEFLNHPTYFVYGPEEIGRKVDADYFYLEMLRVGRGIYEIRFHRLLPGPTEETYPHCREFMREFEKTVRRHPPYWLWSHNRWK